MTIQAVRYRARMIEQHQSVFVPLSCYVEVKVAGMSVCVVKVPHVDTEAVRRLVGEQEDVVVAEPELMV